MYFIGQRWFSEAEPELGIGIVSEQEHKNVTIFYHATGVTRTYSKAKPPIKRVEYKEGDTIWVGQEDGDTSAVVTKVESQNNILFYFCGDKVYPEMLLKSDIFFTNPLDKILAGNFDRNNFFELRYESLLHLRKYQLCNTKGLLGPKVALLAHQLSVTQEINKRCKIRAMLADEVGLGKTIEASLIINSMIQRSKAQKILILTPDSLTNQWFVELYRKFHLSFSIINSAEDIPQKGEVSPFYISNFTATCDPEVSAFILNNSWDMLVVDEAHQISEANKKYPEVFSLVKTLSNKIQNLLLLTATPEILGPFEHFERLTLLDSMRFNDFEKYQKEVAGYKELIPLINDMLSGKKDMQEIMNQMNLKDMNFSNQESFINFLIDCHGTGRIYFRNTRENLEKHNIRFPKRILVPHPLNVEGKIDDKKVLAQKAMIICETLESNNNEKILVICHNKSLVMNLQKLILTQVNVKIASFHSDQSVLERDRQSTYFADPDGARVMLCTEAGSEGRNFEFAHHLFLLDIPKVPDQLEQRIGRLDRIGQSKDIKIHVPYVENSFEEILFSFYDKVIGSFDKCPKGAMSLYKMVHDELKELLTSAFDRNKLEAFLKTSIEKNNEILESLSKGHDRLLDLSSFNEKKAKEAIASVNEMARSAELRNYLMNVFDHLGVDLNELNDHVDYVVPSTNMRIPSYPSLTEDGLRFSFNREHALKHDDIALMSWEHPLATGTVELFTDSELGNVTVTLSQNKMPFNIGFECIFRLECVASKNEDINMFFPMTPLRALVDISGGDYTQKVKMGALKGTLDDVNDQYREQLKSLPKAQLNEVLKKAEALVSQRVGKFTSEAKTSIQEYYQVEISRLVELRKSNPLVGDDDINELKELRNSMLNRIEKCQISVDSIRMIISE